MTFTLPTRQPRALKDPRLKKEPVEIVRAELRTYARRRGCTFTLVDATVSPQHWAIINGDGEIVSKKQGLKAWRDEVRKAGSIEAVMKKGR